MSIDGLLRKAIASSNVGSHAAARAAASEALALAPDTPAVHRVLARVLLHSGDAPAAERALLTAGPIEDVAGLRLHAAILFARGRMAAAVGRAREAVALAPDDADCHSHLGSLLDRQWAFQPILLVRADSLANECERCWAKAIRLSPEHLEARVWLGARALRRGCLASASRFARQCLALDAGYRPGRLLAGHVAWRSGDWTAAREIAWSLLAENGNDRQALALLQRTGLRPGRLIRPAQRLIVWAESHRKAACAWAGMVVGVAAVVIAWAGLSLASIDPAAVWLLVLLGYFYWMKLRRALTPDQRDLKLSSGY